MNFSELPTANLYLTMLHKLGVETNSFAAAKLFVSTPSLWSMVR